MNPTDYDDYRLMELAISLYYEGYSREMLIKKLMEKVNDPRKAVRFYNAVEKCVRVNRDLENKRKAELNRETLKKSIDEQKAWEKKKLSERNRDDDYDYCPYYARIISEVVMDIKCFTNAGFHTSSLSIFLVSFWRCNKWLKK